MLFFATVAMVMSMMTNSQVVTMSISLTMHVAKTMAVWLNLKKNSSEGDEPGNWRTKKKMVYHAVLWSSCLMVNKYFAVARMSFIFQFFPVRLLSPLFPQLLYS